MVWMDETDYQSEREVWIRIFPLGNDLLCFDSFCDGNYHRLVKKCIVFFFNNISYWKDEALSKGKRAG